MKTLYSISDVVSTCGVSESTLRRLIKKGEFPAPFKLSDEGRKVAFLVSEVHEFLEVRQEERRVY